MTQHATQPVDYSGSSSGSPNGCEKENLPSDNATRSSVPAYTDAVYNNQEGEVIGPYGGKKLGMVRVRAVNPLIECS